MGVTRIMGKSGHQGRLLATASRVAITAMIGGLMVPAALAQATGEQQMETVVVSGMRASLESAVSIKRNATQVVDTIVAEDIGKLGDANVAETMTRIPGIQGYRYGGEGASPSGQGSGLTVRGLASFSASRLDGRSYFTAGQREFNIEEAIPGMIAGVDVLKTATAEFAEGGIGGVINVRTRHPFDFNKETFSAAVTGYYNDLVHEVTPGYFGLYSDRWTAGKLGEMGILVAANYQETHNRSDSNGSGAGMNLRQAIASTSANYTAANGCDMAYAGVAGYNCVKPISTAAAYGMSATEKSNLYTLAGIANTGVNAEDILRTRFGANVAFQWKFNDKLSFYAESNYNYYLYHQNYRFLAVNDTVTVKDLVVSPYVTGTGMTDNSGILPAGSVLGRDPNNVMLAGQRFISGTYIPNSTFTAQPNEFQSTGGNEDHPYRTYIIAGGTIWTPTADLYVKLDLDYVHAEQFADNRSVTMVPATGVQGSFSRSETAKPYRISISGVDLSDARSWVFNQYTNGTNYKMYDDSRALQLDAKYNMHGKFFLTEIKAGLRYFEQEERYNDWSQGPFNLTTNGAGLAADRSNAISAANYMGLLGQAPSNWFDGELGYSGGFLTYVPNLNRGDIVRDTFPSIGIPANDAHSEKVGNRRFAREDTYSGYVQGEFAAFDDFITGNVGVRIVSAREAVNAWVANPSGGGYSPNNKSFWRTDVLPALNVAAHINDQTIARFGYSKGLTRPLFSQWNPAIGSVSILSGSASMGNPDLQPLTADSFDLSLEHYFSNGGMVSFALWDKEMEGFPNTILACQAIPGYGDYTGVNDAGCGTQTTGTAHPLWAVSALRNAGDGYARGIELAGQTFFTFLPGIWQNFGFAGSVGYTQSSSYTQTTTAAYSHYYLPLPNSSTWSTSSSLMFENEDFSARVIYTFRSSFTGGYQYPENDRWVKGYGLVDVSASYNLGYGLTLTASASNLTNTAGSRYVGDPGSRTGTDFQRQAFMNGRIYSMGLRFSTGD